MGQQSHLLSGSWMVEIDYPRHSECLQTVDFSLSTGRHKLAKSGQWTWRLQTGAMHPANALRQREDMLV